MASKTVALRKLKTEEIWDALSQWLEAYDEGWRPHLYIESFQDALAKRLREIIEDTNRKPWE